MSKESQDWLRLEPGMLVRNPECPDWGLGQVQSSVGGKVTVNFEHRGKVVVQLSNVALTPVPMTQGH